MLSGTDEVLGATGTLVGISWVTVEWNDHRVTVLLLTCYWLSPDFLNQARAWFLEITFTPRVCVCCVCVCVCVCACACIHPRGHKKLMV